MALFDLTQYGGARAPAVNPQAGGAAVFSNLGSGLAGMTPYGALAGAAVSLGQTALADPASSNTTDVKVTQSTGSKVFNTGPGSSGMSANSFWAATVANKGGSSQWLIFALAAAVVAGGLFFLRKR